MRYTRSVPVRSKLGSSAASRVQPICLRYCTPWVCIKFDISSLYPLFHAGLLSSAFVSRVGRALSLSGSWVRVGHIANDREVLKETRPHVLIGTPGSRSCQRCGACQSLVSKLWEARQARFRSARARSLLQRRGVNFTVRSDGEGHLKTETPTPVDGQRSTMPSGGLLWSSSQCQHNHAVSAHYQRQQNRAISLHASSPRLCSSWRDGCLAPRKGSQIVLHDAVGSPPWELAGSVI